MRSLGREFTVLLSRRHTAIYQEISASDEAAIRSNQQRADSFNFVWRAAEACGQGCDHAAIAFPARPGLFVLGEGREDDAGADRVDPRATLASSHRLGHHAQRIAAFGNQMGIERVRHHIGLQYRQGKKLIAEQGGCF